MICLTPLQHELVLGLLPFVAGIFRHHRCDGLPSPAVGRSACCWGLFVKPPSCTASFSIRSVFQSNASVVIYSCGPAKATRACFATVTDLEMPCRGTTRVPECHSRVPVHSVQRNSRSSNLLQFFSDMICLCQNEDNCFFGFGFERLSQYFVQGSRSILQK